MVWIGLDKARQTCEGPSLTREVAASSTLRSSGQGTAVGGYLGKPVLEAIIGGLVIYCNIMIYISKFYRIRCRRLEIRMHGCV
jgi:hypothetical protein